MLSQPIESPVDSTMDEQELQAIMEEAEALVPDEGRRLLRSSVRKQLNADNPQVLERRPADSVDRN